MISVILPSVRPDNLPPVINSIIDGSIGCEIELILVTDFVPQFSEQTIENLNIKSIIQEERKGPISAINLGYEQSKGDYVFVTNDESRLSSGCLRELQELCFQYGHNVLISPRHVPTYNFRYYNKWFAAFPFAHRSLLERIGGLFDPAYKSFYADPDLSLRAYKAGIEVIECQRASIFHDNNLHAIGHQDNVNRFLEQDRATFRSRWDILGEFKDP